MFCKFTVVGGIGFTARLMGPDDITAACQLLANSSFKGWATPSMLAMQLSKSDVQGIVLTDGDGMPGDKMLGLMMYVVGHNYRELKVFGVLPGNHRELFASALIDLVKRVAVDRDLRIGVSPDLTDMELIQALRERGFHDPSRDWPARHECLLMFNPEWHNDAHLWEWSIAPQSPVFEATKKEKDAAASG